MSNVYLLSGSEHIYWILGLDCEVHLILGFVEKAAFNNTRATFFQSRAGWASIFVPV